MVCMAALQAKQLPTCLAVCKGVVVMCFRTLMVFLALSSREPKVLAGPASGSSLYESESDDGIIYDVEEVPLGKLLG